MDVGIRSNGTRNNRNQRRMIKSQFKKQLKNAIFDSFEDKTNDTQARFNGVKLGKFSGFFVNSIYSVQRYEKEGFIILGIRRHDEKPSCPWKHKMEIKNELMGVNAWAIEIFPSINALIDGANMYWLFGGDTIEEFCKKHDWLTDKRE